MREFMPDQNVLFADSDYAEIDAFLEKGKVHRVMLVCGGSIRLLRIGGYFDSLEKYAGVKLVRFSNLQPNPSYESVVEGVALFRRERCDAVIAVGGGSAIDVAKCIKLFSDMDPAVHYLRQPIVPNCIPMLVVPTTAGTGSEATQYAAIYLNSEKQSIYDESCIPDTVVFDPTALEMLPSYQKKVTMLDALCHDIESFWSVNSTEESKAYARESIKLILRNWEGYIAVSGDLDEQNRNMLLAAYKAGRAIRITQTTAAHAMSYKLTTLYGCAHGHAVALCLPEVWHYMLHHMDECTDPRGKMYLENVFRQVAAAMGRLSPEAAVEKFEMLVRALDLPAVTAQSEDEIEALSRSVNPVRLKNNPVPLCQTTLRTLYCRIACMGSKN